MPQEFTIIIERDPESGWLVGSVAGLPGCYTQVPSEAELESNLLILFKGMQEQWARQLWI